MQRIILRPYVVAFTAVLLAVIAIGLFMTFFAGYEPGGMIGFMQLLVASFTAGLYFVQKNGRTPTREERRRLVWLSFAASLTVAAVMIFGLLWFLAMKLGTAGLWQWLSASIARIPTFVLAFAICFSLGLSLLALFLGYGLFTSRFGAKLTKPAP